MYFNVALNNVKKCFKDYSIYFLTLTLGVCIFYAFNSIGEQRAFLELGNSKKEIMKTIQELISHMSVFISCVLGGLIIYANNFLIKKRKKELGIYMTLGMGKNKISKILTYETMLVGVISLITGLGAGIIVSQGISAFTTKLFEVPLNNYKFLLSIDAILKTILYFGIIFILVMIFNTTVISKYKLINMLIANKKNEDIKIKNPILTAIIFFISLVVLGFAYKLILEVGLNPFNHMFFISMILGILGTLLFFFSLSGFVLYALQKNKNIYLKGLNIFILRQINSKINTNFLSMTVISLILFFTISILSTGISFKNSLEDNIKTLTPFDASISYRIQKDSNIKNIDEVLNLLGFKFNSDTKIASFNEYTLSNSNFENLLKDNLENKRLAFFGANVPAINISSYNNIRELRGEKKINLADNQVLISSNTDEITDALKKLIKNNSKIEINNKEYVISNNSLIGKGKIINEALENENFKLNTITLIVPDNVVSNLEPYSSKVDINFNKDSNENQQKLNELFKLNISSNIINENNNLTINTRNSLIEENNGLSILVVFLGTYLGIIFLISSAAVLGIQQLSESTDSIDRYKSLIRIGVSQKMINKSIFVQTSIYFGLPLVIALIHSFVAIKVINKSLIMVNNVNILNSSIMIILIVLIVYGGYFYTTYIGYKATVKNSLKIK